MHCDPLANAHTDGRDLSIFDPNAGQAGARLRVEVESREQLDQRTLDPTQITMQILTAPPQIDDRVTDQLARPVIGRLATAVSRKKWMWQIGSIQQTGLIR